MIEFKNVTKKYGQNIALNDATIHIDDGDFVFLVGPSGAGKSTFIKLISKEIEADSGTVTVDGKDLKKMSNRLVPAHRRSIGMVFQDFKLLEHKTVYENVAFAMEVVHTPRRTINRQVPQMLMLMGIDDKADSFPSELSAGQQQRVAIARAIINNPRILVADEPTGNLDADTAWEIMRFIEEINKRGTTVVMVTHAKEIVNKMGKRVVAIDGGRIVRDSRGGEYGYND